MASSSDRFQKKKLRSSYFSLFFSNFLILFLLSFCCFLMLKYKEVSLKLKEKVPLQVFLKKNINPFQWQSLEKTLSKTDYAADIKFVSKEKAAKDYAASLGEDFVKVLGENPLKNSFQIKLKPAFVSIEKLQKIEKSLLENMYIDEVIYDIQLVSLLNTNLKKVRFLVAGVFLSFIFISFFLMNNTIRLALYAKRFTIKTMQLVGATSSFIRQPFILKSISVSLLSSFFAIGFLSGILYWIETQNPKLEILQGYGIILTGIFVIFTGCLIAWLSTFFVTRKFLRVHIDALYD